MNMRIQLSNNALGIPSASYIPLDDIESSMQRLALESEFVSNAVGFMRESIPRIAITLRDTVNNLFISEGEDKSFLNKGVFESNAGDVLMKLPAYSFTSISSLVIPVPESFSGNLLKYSDLMTQGSSGKTGIYEVTMVLLGEYSAMLAQFLSAGETRTSLAPSNDLYNKVKKERNEFLAEHKRFFAANTGKSHARVGDVFDRAQDVIDLKPRMPALREAYQNAPISEIKQMSDRCVVMLDAISKLSESNSIERVTPQVAHKLAGGAYEVGKLLELIAVHRVRQETLLKSVFDLFALLKERL